MAATMTTWYSLAHCSQSLFQFVQITDAYFYTFSCYSSHMLWSIGFKSGEFGGHSWSGINFGVSFCYNSMVARVWRAFQVSQGSAETLFRWGKKWLHDDFAANLFRKQWIKFHQNHTSFIEGITKKNTLISFFLDTLYILLIKML